MLVQFFDELLNDNIFIKSEYVVSVHESPTGNVLIYTTDGLRFEVKDTLEEVLKKLD